MPKRSSGQGSIYQRSDGAWEAALMVNGVRKRIRAKSEREANNKLLALQKEVGVVGTLADPGKRTVNDLLDTWLEVVSQTLRPKTIQSYQEICNYYIRPNLGPVRLSKLTPDQIQRTYALLQGKGLTRATELTHVLLHKALGLAVLWRWLPENPCKRVIRPTYSAPRKEIWELDQVRVFLDGTREHVLHPLYVLALGTGCRIGELLGLKWCDVELTSATISIRRSLSFTKGKWVEGMPKTRAGERVIALPVEAVAALHRQRAQQAEWRLQVGDRWQDHGFVFTNETGRVLYPNHVQHVMRKHCRKLQLPPLSPHGLRHVHASLLLSRNLPITAVSSRLGHANPSITMTTYAHAIKRQDVEAAAVIGDVLRAR
jgi:integrase